MCVTTKLTYFSPIVFQIGTKGETYIHTGVSSTEVATYTVPNIGKIFGVKKFIPFYDKN